MDVPVTRKRPAIFYGWYIVAVALLAQCLSAGIQAFAGGVFLKPMTEDLDWSRQSFSSVQAASQVVTGLAGFVVGGLIDRRGPRPLMLIGGVISGAALVATSAVHELWQFYLVRGVGQTIGMALVGNLVVNVTIVRWFVVRRGMAVAIASLGISLGGVLMAPLMAWAIASVGWRETWVLLGFVTWALALPAALVMRRSPEEYGLHPDGMDEVQAAAFTRARGRRSASSEVSFTRHQAVRTPTLWLIILAYGASTAGLIALLTHAIPFLTDHGVSAGTASLLLSGMSWSSLISKLIWAPLMDRVHARYLSAIGFVMAGIAIVALLAAAESGSIALMAVALVVFGFGVGGTAPLQETVWASYFGRMHIGSVRAVGMPLSIVFSAGAPFLAGALYDRTESYVVAFWIFAACSALGTVLILLARPPRAPAERSGIPAFGGVSGSPAADG